MHKFSFSKLIILLLLIALIVGSNLAAATTLTSAKGRQSGPETTLPEKSTNTNHAGENTQTTLDFDWSTSALTAYADISNWVEIIVGTDNSSESYTRIDSFARQNGGKITDTLSMGSNRAVVVTIPTTHASAFVNIVHTSGISRYVEANGKYQAASLPNDPYWSLQWGTKRVGADYAWNTTAGSNDLLVAVIDTGVDYTHPDLQANYVPLGYDFVNNDTDPIDDYGHGTHCAGIIAGAINNSIGIAGVAQVKIMAEKGLDASGSGAYTALAKCIINATDAGADILSNSYGGSTDSSLLSDAMDYATSHGVLVLVAAGNENTSQYSYPAAYDNVIAVAATNISDTRASFSNYGSWVDVAAPGVMIYSTMPNYDVTMFNDVRFTRNYSYCSGTSMACPMAAGVAALIWSKYPNMDAEAVRSQLESTCDDVGAAGFDIYFGYGIVNALRAVTQAPVQHDLAARSWNAPSYVMLDETAVFNLTTVNQGALNETDISISLVINGSAVNSTTITSLPAYTTHWTTLAWKPTETGTYNVSFMVASDSGETNYANNILSTIYTVVGSPDESNWTLLATNVDSDIGRNIKAAHSQLDNGVVFFKVTYYHPWSSVTEDIDTAIMVDSDQNVNTGMPLDLQPGQADYIGTDYMILVGSEGTNIWRWNATTRSWDTINTLPLLYLDAPDNSNTFVVGVSAEAIEVDGFFDCSFNDITFFDTYSVWDWMPDTGYVPFSQQSSMHDLAVTLETNRNYIPDITYTLTVKVFNYGQSSQSSVNLEILIDGAVVNSTSFSSISSGSYQTVTYAWKTSDGYHNITAYATPISGESVTENNVRTRVVPVSPKIGVISDNAELWSTLSILDQMNINFDDYYLNYNYNDTSNMDILSRYPLVIYYNNNRNITSTELTVLNQYLESGGKLIVTGYDSLKYTNAKLAEVVRAISTGDDSSQGDLYVTNASHPIMKGPYGTFAAGYHISELNVDNDAAMADTSKNATTIAELADGNAKIIVTESLPGTVVYWNGIGTDNWVYNEDCQDMFKNMLIWLLDTSAPSTTADYDGAWHSSDFSINLSAYDYFGVNQTYYRINGDVTQTVSSNGQPHIANEGVNNTLEYWSKDFAGNTETHHYLTDIKLDTTAPALTSFTLNNGNILTNSATVTLKTNVTDTLSGLSQMCFSNDNISWSSWETYATTKTWTLNSTEGTETVYVQLKNHASLVSTYSASIILDTTAPTADAGSGKSVTLGSSVTLDGSGSSDSSGIVTYAWSFGDGTHGTGISVSHTYYSVNTFTATLTVEDAAGNIATSSTSIVVNAKSTPTPTATPTLTPTSSPTSTPTPSTSPSTINATVDNGSILQLSVGGNITSTQISNVILQVNQTAATTTITFNITGESGTTGFGNLTIPKSQVSLGASPVIYIDGLLADEQGYTEDANNYYVWYLTHFSTHELSIVFAGTPVTDTPVDYLPLWFALVVVAVVVCVGVAVLFKRQKPKF